MTKTFQNNCNLYYNYIHLYNDIAQNQFKPNMEGVSNFITLNNDFDCRLC